MAGATLTLSGGNSAMLAVALLVGSAALVAVRATVCCAARLAGGVYRPEEETEPVCGEIDQVTAELLEPVTVALNCCGGAAAARLTL